jgi:valyl-tRNA synthetase
LEIIKPEFGKPIDKATYDKSIEFFEKLLKLLHPFMPFITEELWHELQQRSERDCILVADWPAAGHVNEGIIRESEFAFAVVSEIRNTRNAKNISPKEKLNLMVKDIEKAPTQSFWSVIKKLSNLESITNANTQPTGATGLLVGSTELFIPMSGMVDVEKEREAILKEIAYFEGFIASVDKKLSNEKFVSNAKPEVVEIERKKKADAEAKIKALKEALKNLGGEQ